MKNIELTENQKVKLLEMCRILFPESKIKFNDDYYTQFDLFIMSDDDWDDDCDDEMNSKDYVNCHWFEFCMTHLVNKIQIQTNKNYLTSICGSINLVASNNSDNNYKWNHPIDYLYEEFKKLK